MQLPLSFKDLILTDLEHFTLLSFYEGKVDFLDHYIVCGCLHLLNHLTDIHGTWYELYAV
jgi:hypothetical protein